MTTLAMILLALGVFAVSLCFIYLRFLRDRHELRNLISPIPESIRLPIATTVTPIATTVTPVHSIEEGIQIIDVRSTDNSIIIMSNV